MNILKLWSNPTVAFTSFTAWVVLFVIILGFMGAFSEKFLYFGPSNDPETQTEFLGSKIDSWKKVIIIYLLGFFSAAFSTYYYNIFGAWLTNSVKDHKETKLKISRSTAQLLTTLDPIISSINRILELFVTLTLQLQFIIPQILGEIFVTILSARSFLSKKKGFGN